MSNLANQLEPITRDAWPAEDQQALGAWVLRAHRGVTRRANSIWTAGPQPAGWEEAAAGFYGSRGLPVRLQVGDASPPGFDDRLAASGYTADAATSVLTATCAHVLMTTMSASGLAGGSGRIRVSVLPKPSPAWLDAYLALEGFPSDRLAAYEAIVTRLRGASYALASEGRTPVAVALGTFQDGWLGLSCLVTAESHRGQGIGGTLIRTLVQRHPQASVWLQVMDENVGALRLYEHLGFTRAYGYHYRTQPH